MTLQTSPLELTISQPYEIHPALLKKPNYGANEA
jgi:hypothetical protein